MPDHLKPNARPRARQAAIVTSGPLRVTVLTSRLLRIEYSPDAVFEDRCTAAFWNRELPVPVFEHRSADGVLEIETEHLRLEYSGTGLPFTPRSLRCEVRGTGTTWRYGDREWDHNLGGTIRTLDNIDGRVSLGHGLMSRRGWSVIDDSRSVVLNEDGWFVRRRDPGETVLLETSLDLYFFGYGNAYAEALRDFYRVSGQPPALPRYALGVWWSRYWPYTDRELIALVEQFQSREIPIAVSIADMDWHVVENDYTNGWTGYTWNRDLFPDPPAFLREMHERGVRVGLNLHPADGVHPHEAQYEAMREAMGGARAGDAEPVPFEPADARFMEAYLRLLHRPLEDQGVDLWWIDWQQGEQSGLPALDPLLALNHAHFLDLRRDGTPRIVLSRYAGLGSHRYPVGFSGDSIATWESLAFQPELTATAANVGYGWWSHDIGGHMAGNGSPELYLRWVQFGVFSPIFRVHSSRNPYNVRLPWEFDGEIGHALEDAFKLRGRLIPYIATHLARHADGGIPLCTPMYYHYPEIDAAFDASSQYMFGNDLLVAPFVEPIESEVGLARRLVWIPPGDWYHLFSGERFVGPRRVGYYGGIHDTPLFARGGALVPMQSNGIPPSEPHPGRIELHVFPADASNAELIEEDGVSIRFGQREENGVLELDVALEVEGTSTTNEREILVELRGFAPPIGSTGAPLTESRIGPFIVGSDRRRAIQVRWDGSPGVEPEHLRAARARRLLLAMDVPDTVKRTVGARLAEHFDLRALEGSIERLSPVQARALAETVSGRAFEDVLLATGEVERSR